MQWGISNCFLLEGLSQGADSLIVEMSNSPFTVGGMVTGGF